MSLEIACPLVSPTAGDSSEGIVIGGISESAISAVFSTVNVATSCHVYRLDRTGGSLNIINDSTNANSGTNNAFSPFGSNVIPLAATLKVYDSTDGVWAANELTATAANTAGAISPTIDAFKTIGWSRIDFGTNANRRTWSPSLDPAAAITARRYIRFALNDGADNDAFIFGCDNNADVKSIFINVTTAGSTTVAPRLAQVVAVFADDSVAWFDYTSIITGATNVIPTGVASTYIPTVGGIVAYAFTNQAYGLENYVYLRSIHNSTIVVEYLAADNTWKTLTNFTDASNYLMNGPVTATNPPTKYHVRWDIPADWATKTQTVPNALGGNLSFTGYWIRYRQTAVPVQPVVTPLYVARVRQFGNANVTGATMIAARSFTGVTILRVGGSNTTPITCQAVNGNSGNGRAFTIPANPSPPSSVTFSSPLTLSAGDEFLPVVVNSGGTATDVFLSFEG